LFVFGSVIETLFVYPNSLVYYNPLFGGMRGAAKIINTDQAGAGLSSIAYELNTYPNSESITVAVYDSVPFSQYSKSDVRMLKKYNPVTNPVNTDYVIIGVQGDTAFFDIKDSKYKLIKEYKYRGQTHWYMFKKVPKH
jgi:hypothetical protein